jgi:hypothetical protein
VESNGFNNVINLLSRCYPTKPPKCKMAPERVRIGGYIVRMLDAMLKSQDKK